MPKRERRWLFIIFTWEQVSYGLLDARPYKIEKGGLFIAIEEGTLWESVDGHDLTVSQIVCRDNKVVFAFGTVLQKEHVAMPDFWHAMIRIPDQN